MSCGYKGYAHGLKGDALIGNFCSVKNDFPSSAVSTHSKVLFPIDSAGLVLLKVSLLV